VLLDVLEDDPTWADWSVHQLRAQAHDLCINPVIHADSQPRTLDTSGKAAGSLMEATDRFTSSSGQ